MRKTWGKVLTLVLAMVMVFAMGLTAFAAPENKSADLTGHTYKAYKIFSGAQAEDDPALGNVEWGDGIESDDFLTALKADSKIGSHFTDCTTAAEVAKAMDGWQDKSDNAMAFAKLAYANKKGSGIEVSDGATTLDAGYYLVVDETAFAADATDTVKNLALLQLTKKGTFTIENKTDIPEVEKKVYDQNDSQGTAKTNPADVTTDEWQDSADHDVNDIIPYQITGTLPTDFANYEKYYYEFSDVMCAGLTYNADAKVYAVNGETKTEITSQAEITPTAVSAGATLSVKFNNLKALQNVTINKDTIIIVQYTCTLNGAAVMGSEGNPNTVDLTYSNNPNQTGDGTPETGKTPKDTNIVFTYKVVVNKVDEDKKPLPNAGFTLFKKNDAGQYVAVGDELKGEAMTTFTWNQLDDGDYKLSETTTPQGKNTISDIEFTITAEHDILSDSPELKSLSGNSTTGEVTFTASVPEGSLTTDVINESGTELPETGGMGTTIFYVLGTILVLGAGVLLITRRRMSSK